MAQNHRFCSLHGIAYNTLLDRRCPQCTMQQVQQAPEQLAFDIDAQKPVDASGALLDPITLQPVK